MSIFLNLHISNSSFINNKGVFNIWSPTPVIAIKHCTFIDITGEKTLTFPDVDKLYLINSTFKNVRLASVHFTGPESISLVSGCHFSNVNGIHMRKKSYRKSLSLIITHCSFIDILTRGLYLYSNKLYFISSILQNFDTKVDISIKDEGCERQTMAVVSGCRFTNAGEFVMLAITNGANITISRTMVVNTRVLVDSLDVANVSLSLSYCLFTSKMHRNILFLCLVL